MKEFFGTGTSVPPGYQGGRAPDRALLGPVGAVPDLPLAASGRIAVYDSLTAAPRVEDVDGSDARGFIEHLSGRTYQLAREQGGQIPYTLIREIVENFIHARFSEPVVTVLDGGNTIRFSDQGPGISDKDRAFQPGFSTASSVMKRVIRGVGSGLPIVKECLSFSDGAISVEDNLGSGTVVTLSVRPAPEPAPEPSAAPEPEDRDRVTRLSVRQKQVLSLTMELGAIGPSAVSNELKVALSTAYRDLAFLEEAGLVGTDESGKRALTDEGLAFLDDLFQQ